MTYDYETNSIVFTPSKLSYNEARSIQNKEASDIAIVLHDNQDDEYVY